MGTNMNKVLRRTSCSTHRERLRNLYQSNNNKPTKQFINILEPRSVLTDESLPETTTARLTEEEKMAIDYGAKILMNCTFIP